MAVLAAFVAAIAWGSAHHEPWRDEIVALSVARNSPTLTDLWKLMRHEEHPILWYLCLRAGAYLLGSTALPVLSILFATASAFVLLRYCPLPLWFKSLFLLGYFPLFEYAVVWRPYGLSMMLVFMYCALYPTRRRNPVAIGVVLALLANATVLGTIIAGAAGVMLAIDHFVDRHPMADPRRFYAAVAIYVAGVVHTVIELLPDPSVFPMDLFQHDTATVVRGIVDAVVFPAAHAAEWFWVPYPSLWLWVWFATMLAARRFALVAFPALSLFGFEAIYSLAYFPSPRHLGNLAVVVMGALWLGWPWSPDAPDATATAWQRATSWGQRLLLIPLLAGLGYQVTLGAKALSAEVRSDYSSSKRLAAILDADPGLDRAIVIGEPELLALALPYYRDNPVFLPQEGAFRNWVLVQIAGGRRHDCDLGALLATAKDLRARHQVPIVMVLGWRLDGPERQTAFPGMFFEQWFTMTPAAREEFLAQTEFLGRLRDAAFTDENYDVFVLR